MFLYLLLSYIIFCYDINLFSKITLHLNLRNSELFFPVSSHQLRRQCPVRNSCPGVAFTIDSETPLMGWPASKWQGY